MGVFEGNVTHSLKEKVWIPQKKVIDHKYFSIIDSKATFCSWTAKLSEINILSCHNNLKDVFSCIYSMFAVGLYNLRSVFAMGQAA